MTTTTDNPAVDAALTSIPAIVGMLAGNKLASVNTSIQGELSTIENDAGATLTTLQTDLDNAEKSSPLVQAALNSAKGVVTALGVQLPSEDAIFAGLKAAANDLLSALKPAA